MLQEIIKADENAFDDYINNLLHEIWVCNLERYQDIIASTVVIDYDNKQELLNTCRLFAILRYIAQERKLHICFDERYFNKKLHLKEPYLGYPKEGLQSVKLLFTAPQPFYDYNVFYDPYDLITM